MDDSNMSESEELNGLIRQVSGPNEEEKVKRLKTGEDSLEKSDECNSKESTSSSSNTENDDRTPSTSTNDSGFPKHRNSRSRNYRKSRDEDSSDNDSDHNTEPNSPVNNPPENPLSDSPENSSGSDSSSNFILQNNIDSDSGDELDIPVLKKQPPKHTWFVVPEIVNRQMGQRPKLQSSELFQRRCYGSLHCVQRLELMYKLEKHEGCVNSLNFHPDGSLLASGSDDLSVVIWDWKIGRPLLSFDTKHRGNVFQSKFLPLSGDLHIATCARDGQVRLAQISKQEGLRSTRKLAAHHGSCHKLATLLDQPHVILSAGEDGYVFNNDVRNPKSNKIVHVLHNNSVVELYSISSHPLKSHEFCVSGRDQWVRVYDQRSCSSPIYSLHPEKQKKPYELHVTCALYNHNGSEILASYNDDSIYLFDVQGPPGTSVHQYEGHRNGATIKGVNFFGPKSEFIVSGSDCGNIYFWDRNTEAIVQWMLADHNGVVNCLEPHPQLPFICTSGLDWDVKVWVPSYEQTPKLVGLADTVKANYKYRSNFSGGLRDSQMLFTLWRYLQTSSRVQRVMMNDDSGGNDIPSSSSSNRSSNSESYSGDMGDDDDDLYRPPGCTPS